MNATETTVSHAHEVAQGERFEFGANWQKFLTLLDDQRIAQAEQSLKAMLETETLMGRSFLDIGSGSGLFSLAARRLGCSSALFRLRSSIGCLHAGIAATLLSRR